MPSQATSAKVSPVHREYTPLPAFLSYLVPGLGQITQGRVGKGILFFVCVMSLFFYGQYLGNWSNVYLPDTSGEPNNLNLPPLAADLYNRPQFLGQFWVGVAAWPAVLQYMAYDPDAESGPLFGTYQRYPYETRSERETADDADDPAVRKRFRKEGRERPGNEALKPNVALIDYKGKTLNELQREGDKRWDLGWVFTVIAGVLNVMIIYDALAGPAFVVTGPEDGPKE
ncbi:MAG: hypothetical protein HYS12_06155 [Planctomycetes bacterium]|nr:hypothetical protein [Planctomycetota bacterium]